MSVAPETFVEINDEVGRARAKFPENAHMTVALMEEVGELAEAMLKYGPLDERTRKEALQVACVAVRIIEEGDADFEDADREIVNDGEPSE